MPVKTSVRCKPTACTGSRCSRRALAGWLGTVVLAWSAAVGRAAEPGPHFEVSTLADGFDQPTALAQAPDGRLFVAQRGGAISTVDIAAAQVTPWARVDVITDGECGLLGLALHPEFETHPYVYVFATVSTVEQRILRLRDQDGIGVDEVVIRDGIPTRGFVHNGGCVRIGPDGMLYFSVGDNGQTASSQSLATLAGKICRVRVDGTVPNDNPFQTPTGAPRSVYALGLRNPFRFCFAPDGRLFVMDVGSSDEQRREEINLVGPGANLGWPLHEGIGPDAPAGGFVNPLYAYHDEGSSIAGCLIYNGSQFSSEYRGDLLHLDFTSGGLFRARLEGDRVVEHTLLVQGEGGPVDLAMLSDGTLAWCELFTGAVRCVRYIGPPDEQVAGAEPDADDAASDASPPPVLPPTSLCGQGLLAMLPIAGGLLLARRRH